MSRGVVAAVGRPADVLTSQLLSTVCEHPIEVWSRARTGEVVILPRRIRTESRT